MQEEIVIPCSLQQHMKLKAYLDELELASSIPDLYWLPVPTELLNQIQLEHQDSCGPYAMALDLSDDRVVLETLVRAQNQLHCACIALAEPELTRHMLDYLNLLLVKD